MWCYDYVIFQSQVVMATIIVDQQEEEIHFVKGFHRSKTIYKKQEGLF